MRAPEKIRPSVLYIGPNRVWGAMAWDIPYDISHNESSGIRLSVEYFTWDLGVRDYSLCTTVCCYFIEF